VKSIKRCLLAGGAARGKAESAARGLGLLLQAASAGLIAMQVTRRASFALLVIVLAVLALPLVTHPLPPLSDYLNNLSRAYVIANIGTNSDLQRFYVIEWRLVPNLMMDLVVPSLSRLVGIYPAGQIFAVSCLLLVLSGTFGLHRALYGRWSMVPLAASIIIYNEVLLVGVMNYICGIGLALWALAGWIAWRERPWRFAISAVFIVGLFFCHLYAVGLYGLGVLAFEIDRLREKRNAPAGATLADFLASGVPFLAAAALLLMSPTIGLAGGWYWEPWGKIAGLLMVFTVYDYRIAAMLIVAIALALFWAHRKNILRMHPFGWALLLVGGLVYVAMPRAVFSTHLADQRLPVAVAFMLIAALDINLAQRRTRQVLTALLAVVLVLRLAEVQVVWDRLTPQTLDFLRTVRSIERGAQILVVHADRDAYSATTVSDFHLLHAASLATIERSALVSTTFAVHGKHVLQVRPPYRRYVSLDDRIPPSADWLPIAAGPRDETDRYYWSQWPLHFDYVYVLFTRPGSPNPDPEHLRPAAQGRGFQLYQVIKRA
jgi:hypothetical protein